MSNSFRTIRKELESIQEDIVILNLKLDLATELIRLNVHENVANAMIKDIDNVGKKYGKNR